MTVFAVVFGLVVGGVVWETLDSIQVDELSEIFAEELAAAVDRRAREEFVRFGLHRKNYASLTRLLAHHRRLARYLEDLPRTAAGAAAQADISAEAAPSWMLESQRWMPLQPPALILLADQSGRVVEHFQLREESVDTTLAMEAAELLTGDRTGGQLAMIDGRLFLVTADPATGGGDQAGAWLLLIIPVDEEFLKGAQGGSNTDVVTAVFDGDSRIALASSSSDLAAGTSADDLSARFVVTFQSFLDYEGAVSNLQFATLVSRNQLRAANKRVAKFSRRQRATAAVVFILVYSLLFLLVASRLARALRRVADFSRRALGFPEPDHSGGNQLLVLEDWMREHIRRVRDAREEMNALHETEIQASMALTSAIMEASLDSIITIDETGHIIEFNPTAEQVFGLTRAEAVGREISRLIFDESGRAGFGELLSTLRNESEAVSDVRWELSAKRGDGRVFPVELGIKPISLQGAMLFAVYLHDISARRRQEQEIRALAAFPGESPSPVLRVNRQGVITYANDASEPLLGYWACRRSQTLPLNWQMRIQEVLDSEQPRETEIQVGGAYFSLLLAPIIELDYVNIYARDVTEARVASAEARQHQTELVHVCRLSTMGEMATGLAHELNQPLAAIVNYANGTRRRLEMGRIPTAQIEEPLNQITRQAARAGDIIRRLRALVSRRPAQRRPVDANPMVQEVLSFVEYEINNFGVTLETDLRDNLPAVRADLVQIEQVVLNLVRNAVDAVKENPAGERRVWVETLHSPQGGVAIRVRDNGPGLSPEIRNRLFEPFFSTKETGMGMGLAISQTIAKDHGGDISVADVEGPGAAFTLQLPGMFQQESAVAS